MTIQNTWENARKQGWKVGWDEGWKVGWDEGWKVGWDEGHLDGARLSLRRVLAARKLFPSSADDARIDSCTDLAMLEHWLDQAMAAQSVGEVLRVGGAGTPAAPRRRKSKRSA